MGIEIERKFIVPLEHQHQFIHLKGGTRLIQAYLSTDPARIVRLRVAEQDNIRTAKLCIKGPSREGGMVRAEWEQSVDSDWAMDIINNLAPPFLQKTRHNMGLWEVDVMPIDADRHLVVAEFEAPTVAEANAVLRPPWVGPDVTGDKMFVASNLLSQGARTLAWRHAYER